MSAARKVYVFTGGNSNIGKQAVKLLCQEKKPGDILYFTVRDEKQGRAEVDDLKSQGYEANHFVLDITSQKDVQSLASKLTDMDLGIDVLVNSAGMSFAKDSAVPFDEQAKVTINTNYFGTLNVCKTLFPLLKKGARVVNVSSSSGHLTNVESDAPRIRQIRSEVKAGALTPDLLGQHMHQFVAKAEEPSCSLGGRTMLTRCPKSG